MRRGGSTDMRVRRDPRGLSHKIDGGVGVFWRREVTARSWNQHLYIYLGRWLRLHLRWTERSNDARPADAHDEREPDA